MSDPTELIKLAQAESRLTRAPRELVWEAWTQLSTWPKWMYGVLETGPPQTLKEKSRGWVRTAGVKRQIVVTHITPMRKIDIEYQLPMAKLVMTRTLSQKVAEETLFIHEWQFRGLLGPFYKWLMGKTLHKTLSETCDGLKRYVEEQAAKASREG